MWSQPVPCSGGQDRLCAGTTVSVFLHQLCSSQLWPWVSYLTFLCPSVLCKIEITMALCHSVSVRIEWINSHSTFRTISATKWALYNNGHFCINYWKPGPIMINKKRGIRCSPYPLVIYNPVKDLTFQLSMWLSVLCLIRSGWLEYHPLKEI